MRYESECGSGIATHDHHTKAAVAATVLESISHRAESSSVIGIDEGQFVIYSISDLHGFSSFFKIQFLFRHSSPIWCHFAKKWRITVKSS